jgi:hypothetical protein
MFSVCLHVITSMVDVMLSISLKQPELSPETTASAQRPNPYSTRDAIA